MADSIPSTNKSDHPSSGDSGAEHLMMVQQQFVKYQSNLKAYILSLRPDFAEADDILQEVFLVVTRKAGEFKEGTKFTSWALTIAKYKVMEAARRNRTKEKALSAEMIELLSEHTPEDSFFEARLAAVRACLEKLAPRMQEVIRLRYFGAHGPGEIARLLSWTSNSVNVALSRARKLLHDCTVQKMEKG